MARALRPVVLALTLLALVNIVFAYPGRFRKFGDVKDEYVQDKPNTFKVATEAVSPYYVDLSKYFNNKGIGSAPNDANFDGQKNGFPVDKLPPSGFTTVSNVQYQLVYGQSFDNVDAQGQTLPVQNNVYSSLNILAAATEGTTSGVVTITYQDGTSTTFKLKVSDWKYAGGNLTTDYYWTQFGHEASTRSMYSFSFDLSSSTKTIVSITLPITGDASLLKVMHIFAITLQPVAPLSTSTLKPILSSTSSSAHSSAHSSTSTTSHTSSTTSHTSSTSTTTSSGPSTPTVGASCTTYYVTQGGEKCYQIAHANNILVSLLEKYNPNINCLRSLKPAVIVCLSAPTSVSSSIPTSTSSSSTSSSHSSSVTQTTSTTIIPLATPSLQIISLSGTTRQINTNANSKLYQVVEVTIQNIGTVWVRASDGTTTTVTVAGSGVVTKAPGIIQSLGPSEQMVLEIGIDSTGITAGKNVSVLAYATVAARTFTLTSAISVGIPTWKATVGSVAAHQSPRWFNRAKFGLFIHWGIYSIPAYGKPGKEYAEQYWKHMNSQANPAYNYHKKTYGENFNYDDFISEFTAPKWNPNDWLDLITQAGAKYFVLTTKHHDGFGLFKSNVSNRNSVALGPKRDFVKEFMAAAEKNYPDLKRGLYYSLPEFYNPSYKSKSPDDFPGVLPTNPYTGVTLNYTGYIPVTDYVNQYQVPQLLELVHNYEPDIIWCDMEGPNNSPVFQAEFFNQAAKAGREVTVNNRCGIHGGDYLTPEYKVYTTLPSTYKWEATRGIDPKSFGYNAQTPDSMYANASELIPDLVDIVSKNGNFLLDFGPKGDGTVPLPMVQTLKDMGRWLATNEEALFDTTYWWRVQGEGTLRFTISYERNAFYISSLTPPGSTVVVNSGVPIRQGDTITLLGYTGGALPWTMTTNGVLTIAVPTAAQASGEFAWVFKVQWN